MDEQEIIDMAVTLATELQHRGSVSQSKGTNGYKGVVSGRAGHSSRGLNIDLKHYKQGFSNQYKPDSTDVKELVITDENQNVVFTVKDNEIKVYEKGPWTERLQETYQPHKDTMDRYVKSLDSDTHSSFQVPPQIVTERSIMLREFGSQN